MRAIDSFTTVASSYELRLNSLPPPTQIITSWDIIHDSLTILLCSVPEVLILFTIAYGNERCGCHCKICACCLLPRGYTRLRNLISNEMP